MYMEPLLPFILNSKLTTKAIGKSNEQRKDRKYFLILDKVMC